MISKEDETYILIRNYGAEAMALRQIAESLGRIADMLAEMNGYTVEYGDADRKREAEKISKGDRTGRGEV